MSGAYVAAFMKNFAGSFNGYGEITSDISAAILTYMVIVNVKPACIIDKLDEEKEAKLLHFMKQYNPALTIISFNEAASMLFNDSIQEDDIKKAIVTDDIDDNAVGKFLGYFQPWVCDPVTKEHVRHTHGASFYVCCRYPDDRIELFSETFNGSPEAFAALGQKITVFDNIFGDDFAIELAIEAKKFTWDNILKTNNLYFDGQ